MPAKCDGSAPTTPWSVGVSVGAIRTTIDFGDRDVALDERSVGASLGYQLDPRRSLGAAVGVILDGETDPGGDLSAGGLVSISGAWLALLERPRRPFVQVSASISASWTPELTSLDARLGVMVGKAFGPVVPYLAGRAFGGPVFFDGDAGGDRYHVTLGGGVTLRLPRNLGVFVEVLPLGEQAASAGVSARF